MTPLESILLGLLQGVFEWLPISSTGEIVLAMVTFFDRPADEALRMAFFLHAGTAISAIVYFRRDVIRIVKGLPGIGHGGAGDARLARFLVISTTISAVVGYGIYQIASGLALRGDVLIGLIGAALIVTGLVQRAAGLKGTKSEADLNWRDSVLLGVAQAFSAIPGISRSGITVSALLFRGYSAKEALRISFLMGIPAILAAQAGIVALDGFPDADPVGLGVGLASAFAAGYLSIGVLLRVAERIKFWLFAVIIGTLALLSYAMGQLLSM